MGTSFSQDSTKHTKNQLIAYYKNMLDSYLQIRISHFANIMNLFPNKFSMARATNSLLAATSIQKTYALAYALL